MLSVLALMMARLRPAVALDHEQQTQIPPREM